MVAVALAAVALLTGCSTSQQPVTDAVKQPATETVFAAITADWARLAGDASQACRDQLMGQVGSSAALADFAVTAKAYNDWWVRALKAGGTGPAQLPHAVTVPSAGADWCTLQSQLSAAG